MKRQDILRTHSEQRREPGPPTKQLSSSFTKYVLEKQNYLLPELSKTYGNQFRDKKEPTMALASKTTGS